MSYSGLLYNIIFKQCLRPSGLFNKTDIIHTTTSVSSILNVLCIRFKIQTLCIVMLIIQICERVETLFTGGSHVHDHVISL